MIMCFVGCLCVDSLMEHSSFFLEPGKVKLRDLVLLCRLVRLSTVGENPKNAWQKSRQQHVTERSESRALRLYQIMPNGVAEQFALAVQLQFSHDVGAMFFRGANADAEGGGDRIVLQSFRGQLQNHVFATR